MNFIAAALIFVFGLGCGVWVRMQHYDAKGKKHAEQHLADETHRARVAIRQAEKAIQAQVASAHRVDRLRRDAAGSRRALVSLSSAADQAVREARASHDACLVVASAERDVLTQCSEKYQALGKIADHHASDLQTVIDAWPK